MVTKYKFSKYGKNMIERVEVLRETEKCVFIEANFMGARRERREVKDGEYFDTFSDAQNYALSLAKKELESAQLRLKRAQEKYETAKALKQETHNDKHNDKNSA